MPDVIDATKGGSDANSYADGDTADEYLDNLYGTEDWAGQGDDTKDRCLLTTTKIF